MGQPAGVDHDPQAMLCLGLQKVDQRALVVRLEGDHRAAQLRAARAQPRVDIVQGHMPIDLGLAPAEGVQVRAVQHQHAPLDIGRWDRGHDVFSVFVFGIGMGRR